MKSELAALDRKIQLELAPPTPEVAEKENEGQQLKPEAEDVRNRPVSYTHLDVYKRQADDRDTDGHENRPDRQRLFHPPPGTHRAYDGET